jgi:hypothetical protein
MMRIMMVQLFKHYHIETARSSDERRPAAFGGKRHTIESGMSGIATTILALDIRPRSSFAPIPIEGFEILDCSGA